MSGTLGRGRCGRWVWGRFVGGLYIGQGVGYEVADAGAGLVTGVGEPAQGWEFGAQADVLAVFVRPDDAICVAGDFARVFHGDIISAIK